MKTLTVDPARTHLPETGIYVRAREVTGGAFESVDIAHLDRPSLNEWLRSRDSIDWPISVVMTLLGHRRDPQANPDGGVVAGVGEGE